VLKILRRQKPWRRNVLRAGCNSPPAVIARKVHSPRALGDTRLLRCSVKVSRPGVIPGPTVIVRMKRERDRHPGAVCDCLRATHPRIPFDS
jgi:hypothetical protein